MDFHLIIDFLPFLFLVLAGEFSLSAFRLATLYLGKLRTQEMLSSDSRKFLFFRIVKKYFPKQEWEGLQFFLSSTNLFLHFFSFLVLLSFLFSFFSVSLSLLNIFLLGGTTAALLVLFHFAIFWICSRQAKTIFTYSASLSSLYLYLFFPIHYPFAKLGKRWIGPSPSIPSIKLSLVKEDLLEMIKTSDLGQILSPSDQRILASFLAFKGKVAREIMVPRIHIFSLPVETTIREAGKLFLSEDYSRVPVYKDTMDTVVGVLLYKTVLKAYAKGDEKLLESSIETLLKPAIYSPENKKISQLFQEFRKKQSHLAIVVNEYGGTEGVITIEDILEALLGEEIEDEYDVEKEQLFLRLPNGSWIVDAKMNIVDIENQLEISIPHHPEYETLGGYVFHRAGTIPSKSWKIDHDDFELEILSSNERCIKKIRITPK